MVVFLHLKQQSEHAAEMADLAGMYDAEMTARILWKDAIPERPAAYWYDADRYILIPDDESKPEAYGRGSSIHGGAVSEFNANYEKDYNYDERIDYQDKVIYVEVSGLDGDLDVAVSWVNVD